jgi:hypothetical protein
MNKKNISAKKIFPGILEILWKRGIQMISPPGSATRRKFVSFNVGSRSRQAAAAFFSLFRPCSQARRSWKFKGFCIVLGVLRPSSAANFAAE